MMRSNENISPKVMNLVLRHLAGLQNEKLDGVHLMSPEHSEDPLDIQAIVEGPTQTPYEGGCYRVKLCIPPDFPQQPPKAMMLTRIFHPNISPQGEVCVNSLKRDWDPQNWSISHILQVIRCLLIVPFPESALNEEAGRLFMESYDEYHEHASMINRVHATPKRSATHMEDATGSTGADGAPEGSEEALLAAKKAAIKVQKAKKSNTAIRRL